MVRLLVRCHVNVPHHRRRARTFPQALPLESSRGKEVRLLVTNQESPPRSQRVIARRQRSSQSAASPLFDHFPISMLIGDDSEDIGEEELIQLAIAASLSECPAGTVSAASEEARTTPQHGTEESAQSQVRDSDTRAGAGGAWGRGTPKALAPASPLPGGAWASPSPSARTPGAGPPEGSGAAGDAGGNVSRVEERDSQMMGPDAMPCAEFIGTGHSDCANEDEAIVGVPLCEIAAHRVVRFRVPLIATPARAPGSSNSPSGKTDDDANGHRAIAEDEATHAAAARGGAAVEHGEGELSAGQRWVIHGYDAMSLARWLLRDQRLPLTSHRVNDEDVGKVWGVFMGSADVDDLCELEGRCALPSDLTLPYPCTYMYVRVCIYVFMYL
jgi:hypothetical protein